METISLREYARRRGVSDTAVRKAINAGKIVEGRIFESGIPRIIEAIADKEWNLYETRAKVTQNPTTPATKPVKPAAPHTQAPAVVHPVQDHTNEPPKPPAGSLAAARLVQAQLKAKLLEIEVREKSGRLVDRDKVYAALFSAGKELRTALQSIPDRFIDEIIAAGSRNEAHTVLYNAIADALERSADFNKVDITK